MNKFEQHENYAGLFARMEMITFEVGKTYMMDTGLRVECIYKKGQFALMLLEAGDAPDSFWVDTLSGYGLGDEFNEFKVEKEIPRRKTAVEFLNVYEEMDGTLYGGGSTHASLDIAARNAVEGRVGVVEVILVNNIETGEVEK